MAAQALQLGLSVLVARRLGPEALGRLVILLAVAGYAEKFGRLSLDQAAVYLIGQKGWRFGTARRHLFWASAALSLVWVALMALLAQPINRWLLKSASIPLSVWVLTLAHIPAGILLVNSRRLLSQAGLIGAYNATIWGAPLFQLAVLGPWAMVYPNNFNLITALGASAAVQGLLAFYANLSIRRHDPMPEALQPGLWRELFVWGWKFYGVTISELLQLRIDLPLVAYFLTPRSTAYYSLAVTASRLAWRLPQALNVLFYPLSAGIISPGEAAQFAVNALRHLLLWLALAGVAGAALIYPLTALVYGNEFLPLTPAFLVLLPGAVAMGLAKLLLEYFKARGQPNVALSSLAWALAANVLLNLALIPLFGIKGSAAASTLSYLLTLGLLLKTFIAATGHKLGEFIAGPDDAGFYRSLIRKAHHRTSRWAATWGGTAVLILALGVRLGVFLAARHVDYGFSTGFKLAETARNFLEGRGFAWDPQYLELINKESQTPDPLRPRLEVFEEVPAPPADPERLELFRGRPPGYSVVLAATWKIFGKKKFVYSQFLFSFLDVLAAMIIWWLALELFGPTAALISGALYALSLPHAVLSILSTHDAVGSFPVAASLGFFWLALRSGRRWPYAAAGLAAGLGGLMRQEPFLIPSVLAAALALSGLWRQALIKGVLMQMTALACLLPWGFRNLRTFGHFSLAMPAYGMNLLGGIGEYPNKWGVESSDQWIKRFVHGKGNEFPYHSAGFNRVCMDEFLRIVREDPSWFAASVLKRALKSLTPTIMPFEKSYTRYYRQRLGREGVAAYAKEYPVEFMVPIAFKAAWLTLWILSGWALVGFIHAQRGPPKIMAWGLAGTIVYYMVSHVPMHLEHRFLLPGYFPLMILGAAGLKRFYKLTMDR